MLIEFATILPKLGSAITSGAASLAQKSATKLVGLDELSKSLREANKFFVDLFKKELDYREALNTILGPVYRDALECFCSHDAVQQALAVPFDAMSQIAGSTLAALWEETLDRSGKHLAVLPSGFDWNNLATKYCTEVRRMMRTYPELRHILDSVNVSVTAEQLQKLAGVRPGFDLDGYRRTLKEQYGLISISLLDPEWHKYSLRLPVIFVEPNAKEFLVRRRRNTADEASSRLDASEDGEGPDRPVLDSLEDREQRCVVIIGPPGAGKSTLVQYISLRWADTDEGAVPFLIELRRYVGDSTRPKDFLAFLESGEWTLWRFSQLELDRFLKSEASLLIFDGLDEVVDARRRAAVISEVVRFSREYPKARIVVTTRPVGYLDGSRDSEHLRNAGFSHFTLQPFTERQTDAFIRIWHREVFADSDAERNKYEARVKRALYESGAIRELATNPLLLTLMCLLSRKQELPRDRIVLYDRCSDLLLSDWDSDKFTSGTETLRAHDKRQILQRVAYSLQNGASASSGYSISELELRTITESYLLSIATPDARTLVDELVLRLRDRHFMLATLGNRHYAFVHRAFLEYFCAMEIQYRFEKSREIDDAGLLSLFRLHWPDPTWPGVLRLVCGLIGFTVVRAIIEEIFLPNTGGTYEATFFAADCLSEVREVQKVEDLREVVQQRLRALLKFRPPGKGAARAHLIVEVRSGAALRLARYWRHAKDTIELLKQVATGNQPPDVRAVAVKEVASGWIFEPTTWQWLRHRSTVDAHPLVRLTALQQCAGHVEAAQAVLLLRDAINSDKHPLVRQAAIEDLVRRGASLEVRQLLESLTRDDPHAVVRQTAVRLLARHWPLAPETPECTRKAASDQDRAVRQTAIREYSRLNEATIEVLRWLQERATVDPIAPVRQSAIWEITARWSALADVLEWLCKRVADDELPAVRRFIVRELLTRWPGNEKCREVVSKRTTEDRDPGVRQYAIRGLAACAVPYPNLIPILRDRILTDASVDVRRICVQLLSREASNNPEVIADLIRAASRDHAARVRDAAVEGLAFTFSTEGRDPLLAAKSLFESPKVLARVIKQLGEASVKAPSAAMTLAVWTSKSHDSNVRRRALAQVLARGRAVAGVVDLLVDRALNEPTTRLRETVIKRLGKYIRDHADVRSVLARIADSDSPDSVRIAAAEALIKSGVDISEQRSVLTNWALQHPIALVRSLATHRLGVLSPPDSHLYAAFVEITSDVDGSVRRQAVRALIRLAKVDPRAKEWVAQQVAHSPGGTLSDLVGRELERHHRRSSSHENGSISKNDDFAHEPAES